MSKKNWWKPSVIVKQNTCSFAIINVAPHKVTKTQFSKLRN